MIEPVLFVLMAASLAGMVMTGFDDPLSHRFWDQWRK